MYLYNFNPCCSGRWSHTYIMIDVTFDWECLNPYCSGQWSRTEDPAEYARVKLLS